MIHSPLPYEPDEAEEYKRASAQLAASYTELHGDLIAARREAEEMRARTIEKCATVALEERCERGNAWDLACMAIVRKIRALAKPASAPAQDKEKTP